MKGVQELNNNKLQLYVLILHWSIILIKYFFLKSGKNQRLLKNAKLLSRTKSIK